MPDITRLEHDFLGEREIPETAYYGIQTLRAQENFRISGQTLRGVPELIRAFGLVKKAAALANRDCDVLTAEKTEAIVQACDAVIAGELDDHFVVDLIQGGAGTSTNMNANEVIANKGLEIMGHSKGAYQHLHPNNDVNCSQSTNDAYPTAFRLALYDSMDALIHAIGMLAEAFEIKGEEFADVLKMGRTQLQDAVPMTLGAEFHAYAVNLREDIGKLEENRRPLLEVNMGATAIGTGINAPEGYQERVMEHLRLLSGKPVVPAESLMEATWDTGAYVQLSGTLKRFAVKISKICNDLRLLSSGPRAGLNEINLPQLQPGSSIMPAKVNPVIPEVVNQIAFLVIGHDLTVTFAAEAGQLQLNVMEPVMAYALFNSIRMMTNGVHTLREKCVSGITANREVCEQMVMNSVGLATALNPILGYEASSAIAKEALKTGRSVREIVLEKGLMPAEKLDELFSAENLVRPGIRR